MVGIGGIGMSALAQLLSHRGVYVSGSDRDDSPTTELLRTKGIAVAIGHGTLPEETELLIYSDAVPQENAERAAARERGVSERSYFEMLGEISRDMRTIAVAGTHGKTTTTGMLTKILVDAGASPTAVIGSIVTDFGSNFVAGMSDIFVVEACEYRNHLLQLCPEILVITNIEHDHTDFFLDLHALQETFSRAVQSVPPHGTIVADPNDPIVASALEGTQARVIDYTKKAVGELSLIGEFNRMNARAALSAAEAAYPKLSLEGGVRSLSAFKGSWRRFEGKGVSAGGAQVFDDYAHHPTAIEKTIAAARERYPGKRIIVAFHPHLYSRTRDLFQGFVSALSTADRVLLAPVYAARESDPGDVSSERLAAAIHERNPDVLALPTFDAIRAELSQSGSGDIVITMGAGDIYKVAEQLVDA
jgi:UDP-N-acetylmuramate--alanine ligase